MNSTIELNMNFDQPAQILHVDQHWQNSPAEGVSRVHLERCALEHGHATSIVKFSAGAEFTAHAHPGEKLATQPAYGSALSLCRERNHNSGQNRASAQSHLITDKN